MRDFSDRRKGFQTQSRVRVRLLNFWKALCLAMNNPIEQQVVPCDSSIDTLAFYSVL